MSFKGTTFLAQRFVPYYEETETKARTESYYDGKSRVPIWYLLESTVDSVWTADVEAQ